MIKSCLKWFLINQVNRTIFKNTGVSPRTINGLRFFTDQGENQEKLGKVLYIPRHRKVVDEMRLIQYENRFQNQRYDKLSPIKESDYKTWLTTVCLKEEDSSLAFNRKFKRVKVICQVYNDILLKTFRVPSQLTTNSMQELIEIDITNEDIAKQIHYLYDLEMKRWIEKEFRKEEVVKTKERLDLKHSGRTSRIGLFDDKNEIIYGLWHNTLFTRIRTVRNKRNYVSRTRLKTSAIFGQKIVIDFGFDEFMNKISLKQLMSYLVKTMSFNKYNLEEPYDISFNNFNKSGFLMKLMDNYFHLHDLNEYYIDVKSDSYLNHFNSANLCYICPQADQPLREYDHNLVYVLPGVVHNLQDPPLSMMRVKHEGIQMKRIPVEDYGIIKQNYHLELFHSLQILSHLRDYNDMNKAFELYLPKTVWKREEELEGEDEIVVKKLFYKKMIGFQQKTKTYRSVE